MGDAREMVEDVSVTRAGQARTAPSALRTSMGHLLAQMHARQLAHAQVMAVVTGQVNVRV